MNRKILFVFIISISIALSACAGEGQQSIESNEIISSSSAEEQEKKKTSTVDGSSITESSENDGTEVNMLRRAEELLQGTWEYYVPDTGFKEVLMFNNGKVVQNLTVKEYDYRGLSEGDYEVSENYIVVSLDGHKDNYNYATRGDKMTLSLTVTDGIDKGTTRKYLQTSKGVLKEDGHLSKDEAVIYRPSYNGSVEQSVNNTNVSISEKNALEKALQYLNYTAFSHSGLVSQLKYEGFTHSEAQYGADNCGADWNEQAAKKAKDYLSFSAFSYNGLIEQLEYEGFTYSEARYGADNCEADWNEQVVKKAKQYLEYSPFSKSELINQLVFEGFTREQAEYGVITSGLAD